MMICPHCSNPKPHKNGKTKSGSQRYRCAKCRKSWSSGVRGRTRSHPLIACPFCQSQNTKSKGGDRVFCKDCKRSWTK